MSNNKTPGWQLAVEEAKEKFTVIAAGNGGLVDYAQESYFALQILEKSDYLQKAELQSIINAVVNVATIGLTLNPAMKLAYLVPRKPNKSSPVMACLDISYIGLVKLATDSGSVLQVASVPVREKDSFTWKSPFDLPIHHFNPFAKEAERGQIVGVYTAARLSNGCFQLDAISREEIDKIRNVSRAENGPWKDWFEEMVKKTGIKRASKLWPRTQRLASAEAILNEHEGIEFDHQEEAPAIEGPKAKSEIEGPKAKSEIGNVSILDRIAACKTLHELDAVYGDVQAMPQGEDKKLALIAGKNKSKQLKEKVAA